MDNYIPAPNCKSKDGKHNIKLMNDGGVWYARCLICGERFALISETIINSLGLRLEPRAIKRTIQ